MLTFTVQDTKYSLTPFYVIGRNSLGHSWTVVRCHTKADAEKVIATLATC